MSKIAVPGAWRRVPFNSTFLLLSLVLAACGDDGVGPGAGGGDGGVLADAGTGGGDGGLRPDAGTGGGDGGVLPDAGPGGDVCGDSISGITEACDDGDATGGDGCSETCTVEAGFRCPKVGPCVAIVCGDKRIDLGETCDDGDAAGGDGCSASCQLEPGYDCSIIGAPCRAICGDGLRRGFEQCDDGNDDDGDACSNSCELSEGYQCSDEGVCYETTCGDGVTQGTEQCDDGGTRPFDGCSPTCKNEPACSGGSCVSVCGDGVILPTGGQEPCDDGNTLSGDGCSATCQIEAGFSCNIVPEPPADELRLPVIYRDMKGIEWYSQANGGHPDFNDADDSNGDINFGIVDDTLVNGRPVLVSPTEKDVDGEDNGNPKTTEGFAQWYTDTPGVNMAVVRELVLSRNGSTYSYDSGGYGFYPIDDAGWVAEGSEAKRATDGDVNEAGDRNFNFTTEIHFFFQYEGDEVLEFSGDDDLWVFIDGKLCLDVGGLHPATDATMDLNDPSNSGDAAQTDVVEACKTHLESLGPNPIVEMVIFHAERHTQASNFKLTLTDFQRQTSTCASTCGDGVVAGFEACDLGVDNSADGSSGCTDLCTLGAFCGDGEVQPPELCDDGINAGGYGMCAPGCMSLASCGDGVPQFPEEACDAGDQNGVPGSGCSAVCKIVIGGG